MTQITQRVLEPIEEFGSVEASLAFGQLEDLTRRIWPLVEDADAAELAWQPAPGMNTIGMLLAHIPIAEAFWVAELTQKAFLCEQVLGIGPDDDGMPLPDGGLPPKNLDGKTLAYYRDLMMRAREHTRMVLAPLDDADLTRPLERRSPKGTRILNGRWILFHMVEHLGGHLGQIGLLRHLYRLQPDAV